MKFPSISRIPKHRKFNYEPRYYDPVKEDIKNRTERIRSEIDLEKNKTYRQNIREAFNQRDRDNKKTDFMQLLLITIMLGTFVGWLYYGNAALYAFLVLFPLYIFLRTRRSS
jgi:hypothetical protein